MKPRWYERGRRCRIEKAAKVDNCVSKKLATEIDVGSPVAPRSVQLRKRHKDVQ